MYTKYYLNQLREKLWFRPLLSCIVSIIVTIIAYLVDNTGFKENLPSVDTESLRNLLNTISSTMLVISIFTVGAMLASFSSASSSATPRSFQIVVTDDVSQNALSVFIGAFIFSIVATTVLDNGYYQNGGKLIIFIFTIIIFTTVILMFLKWVDRISRLGRMGHTIKQIEDVALITIKNYVKDSYLQGAPISDEVIDDPVTSGDRVGYVQFIDIADIQELAEEQKIKIRLNCRPGAFIHSKQPIAYITKNINLDLGLEKKISEIINKAININDTRTFDNDPRFGLIALTEIASKALSPGINDPGTAIQIITTHARLFSQWNNSNINNEIVEVKYHRVEVPNFNIMDLFDDAFRPIIRDGAGNIEVMLRLQKGFKSMLKSDNSEIQKAARHYSKQLLLRAAKNMEFDDDLKQLRKVVID